MKAANADHDFNICDDDQVTPLHIASEQGYLKIIKFIFDIFENNRIENVNPIDRWGCTPYDLAVLNKNKIVINYLRNKLAT